MPLGTIVGGIMAGNAAAQTQRKLDEIIQTPGVDVGAAYGEALGAIDKNQAAAQKTASATNTFSQGELDRILNQSIPGYSELQSKRAGAASSMLSGDLPPDVARAVRASSASRALEGGYGGSPAGRNLEARDLGLTSLDLIGRGNDMTSGIIGSTPLAKLVGTSDLLNLRGGDVAGLRSGERTQKMAAMRDRAIAPGKTAVFGNALAQEDAQMMSLASSLGGAAAGGAI